jgi:hypothetical protein
MAGRQRGGDRGGSSPQETPPQDPGTQESKEPPSPDDSPDDGYGYGPPDREQGEAVEAHAEFVARHFGGGIDATPDLLDRALEVWQRLPGAVVRSPAQIRPNRPAAGDDDEDTAS